MSRSYTVAPYTSEERAAMHKASHLVKRAITDDVPKDVFDDIFELNSLVVSACVEARHMRTLLLNKPLFTFRRKK